ncbi:WD40 repeat domain-containing protein [Bacteroides fragilis]|uniref:WD40 repeat domain-containing protein n=1 Tax=Bacteroides fragilis TaxID=817 RepID=UPI001CDD43B2|nr:WD40 repeat domain-containing protein [Bacteroides fragilis]MCA4537238.1 WD40 repeat domain-containing protein [Bacteroides fragilis]MCA4546178.1 WD40 repeat domain-containing protein [Bacteroides fragilis]MCA4559656.1 WD40 repeat domain-containing protein [Bacteroides fragilis]MCA4578502.1 WD40 repeat domain-containing protein [Bacteroides fragilis]MCA4584579.1 WD40 repeat domain-containing protein [Bacteroides fragilis]
MNRMKCGFYTYRGIAFCFVAAMFCGQTMAQVVEKRGFDSQKKINAFDNTTFCTAYLSDGALYTMRDIAINDVRKIERIVFNPTGSSIALLRAKNPISIYSFRDRNKKLFELKEKRKKLKAKPMPVSMCYSADARSFIVGNSLGEIVIYDTKEYMPLAYIQGEAPATALAMSSNNYFIAAAAGQNINIWNFQTKELRKAIPMPAVVKEVTFSPDAALLAVTTDDNHLTIIDTKNWDKVDIFDKLGGTLSSPSFHPEGKYISVVKDGKNIEIINLKNGVVEQDIVDPTGGVTGGRFFKNNQNSEVFLLTNRTKQMVFWDANGLNPFYGKIMGREVDAKMNEWVKMMQGESMEDYAIRVNDETRIKQQQLFAQEVATALASDRISMDNPFIDGYDASNNMLNIGFKGLPSIGLEVPSNEAGDFKDGKMKFSNAVYVLNDKDEFELAYVEVTNETTNKVYIYDNIGRTKLTALEADENFVPLEIMQQATREEAQLAEIKEQVIEEKKQDKLITDNTQINVKTEVIPGVDANGKKILNYKVGYQYEVINKEFSAKEDFPSGGYNIERSNAAMSLMKIIKNAFEGDFAKYLSEGKQVKVIITGSADAAPIRGRLAYDGRYGEFVDEPYYKDGNLDNITVTKAGGITQNEQLALMRAAGVKTYIEKNVTTLGNTKNEYEYHVEVAKERGGEFRKINVEFVIMDAFQQ